MLTALYTGISSPRSHSKLCGDQLSPAEVSDMSCAAGFNLNSRDLTVVRATASAFIHRWQGSGTSPLSNTPLVAWTGDSKGCKYLSWTTGGRPKAY